jgi:ProP effector
MSNASLKEQLQALSLGPSEKNTSSKEMMKKRNTYSQKSKPARPKPAWLEQAQYGVELLKTYFPACFKDLKDIQPLKIGIKQDLVKQLSNLSEIVVSDKACMVKSLSYYVNSIAYLKNVVVGANRLDLNGNIAGVVTAAEAKYSEECRQAKLLKKKNIKESGSLENKN